MYPFALDRRHERAELAVREWALYCEKTLRDRLDAIRLRVLPHGRVGVRVVGG